MPVRQAEASREFFADPERVFSRKHECDSLLRLVRNCIDGGCGRMAGHRAGIAEAEIDILVAVNVSEVRAVSFRNEDWKFAGPFFHPIHGYAAEERALGAFVERGGSRAGGDEVSFFA